MPAVSAARPYTRLRAPVQDPADFKPAGDQPTAIDAADRGRAARGSRTSRCSARPGPARPSRSPTSSSGPAPDARDRAQQVARRPARERVPRVLPRQRGRVLRQLLRLLPARGLRPARPTPTSRRTRRSTTRSSGCGTRRPRRCSTRRDVLIVASVSCIYGLGSPEEYEGQILRVAQGHRGDRLELAMQRLVDIQYQRNQVSLARGKFRVQGDALEVFPPYEETGIRIEWWGDDDRAHHAVRPDHRRDRSATSPRSRSSRPRTTSRPTSG